MLAPLYRDWIEVAKFSMVAFESQLDRRLHMRADWSCMDTSQALPGLNTWQKFV